METIVTRRTKHFILRCECSCPCFCFPSFRFCTFVLPVDVCHRHLCSISTNHSKTSNYTWISIFNCHIGQTVFSNFLKALTMISYSEITVFFPFHVDDMNQWPKWKLPKLCAKPIHSAQTLISLRWSLTFQLLVWRWLHLFAITKIICLPQHIQILDFQAAIL